MQRLTHLVIDGYARAFHATAVRMTAKPWWALEIRPPDKKDMRMPLRRGRFREQLLPENDPKSVPGTVQTWQ
jgi:hypothetical protein